jgi:hypothetical protein
MTGFHMTELLKALSSSSAFSRGLPKTGDLQDTSLVQVFRDVLLAGSIVVDYSFDELSMAAVKSLFGDALNWGGFTTKLSPPPRLHTVTLQHRYTSLIFFWVHCLQIATETHFFVHKLCDRLWKRDERTNGVTHDST